MSRIFLFAAFFLLLGSCVGQTVEDGYLGIKPLSTTRSELEEKYGNGEKAQKWLFEYKHDARIVRVRLSAGECANSRYKVTRDTVLSYDVVFISFPKLSDLVFDKRNFYRDTSGDSGSIVYRDQEHGISIGTQNQLGVEYVQVISYYPGRNVHKECVCSK